MLNVSIKGNGNTVNFPSQQQLNLETKEPFTVRLEPSIKQQLEELASRRGIPARTLGAMFIKRWMRAESKLMELSGVMDEILS